MPYCLSSKLFPVVASEVFDVWTKLRPVGSIPEMEVDLHIRDIELVPCFPCQVSLVLLFPVKEVFKFFVIASIRYKVSMTEIEARSNECCFPRPRKVIIIHVYVTRARDLHSRVIPELKPSHRRKRKIFLQRNFTIAILIVCHCKGLWIDCEYRVFTCITAVELFN